MPRLVIDSKLTIKLMLVVVVVIGAYVNLYRVARETAAQKATRELNSADAAARRSAVTALGDAALEEGMRVVPPLSRAVSRDADVEVRFLAAAALGNLPGPSDDAAEALIGALNDNQPRVRSRTALSLGMMASLPRVESALIRSLSDPSPDVRAEAASALGRGEFSTVSAFEVLAGRATDTDPEIRAIVLEGLAGRCAGSSKMAQMPGVDRMARRYLAVMMRGMDDPSARVRRSAARGLEREPWFLYADSVKIVDRATAALADPDPEVRVSAVRMVVAATRSPASGAPGAVWTALLRALPALLRAVADEDDRVRIEAVREIRNIYSTVPRAPGADELSPIREALRAVLESPMPDGRAGAIRVLHLVAPIAEEEDGFVLERLRLSAKDPAPIVRQAVMQAYGRAVDEWFSELRKAEDLASYPRTLDPGGISFYYRPVIGLTVPVPVPSWESQISDIGRALCGSIALRFGDHRSVSWAMAAEPVVFAALSDPDGETRRGAYAVSWRLEALVGSPDGTLRPALMRQLAAYLAALDDPAPVVRERAAWALGWAPREEAPRVQRALRQHARDEEPKIRDQIKWALGSFPRAREEDASGRWPLPEWPTSWSRAGER